MPDETQPPKPLLKKSAVKKRLLEIAATERPGQFTRISEATFLYLEDALDRQIAVLIAHQPTGSKTIHP